MSSLTCTRVFTPGGRVAHLLSPMYSPNSGQAALCGVAPGRLWYGTGNWDEMERADRMPTCVACTRRLDQAARA